MHVHLCACTQIKTRLNICPPEQDLEGKYSIRKCPYTLLGRCKSALFPNILTTQSLVKQAMFFPQTVKYPLKHPNGHIWSPFLCRTGEGLVYISTGKSLLLSIVIPLSSGCRASYWLMQPEPNSCMVTLIASHR